MRLPRFPLIILTRRRLNGLLSKAGDEGYDIGYRAAKVIDEHLNAAPTRKKAKPKKDKP